jgi:uncharacterized surface protein with fasciclin (FAS1) repeats
MKMANAMAGKWDGWVFPPPSRPAFGGRSGRLLDKAAYQPKTSNQTIPHPMKIVTKILALAALILLPSTLPPALADDAMTGPGDIVAVASGAGNFKTLVAAVKAAGLVETLQGKGPFTVFAPTDDAFAKLPKDTLDDLLKPENKEKLAGILTYHVIAGKVMAADVKTMSAKTVNGKELNIKVEDGKVTVNDANVVKTDIAASNGVIHVIDTVLLPK